MPANASPISKVAARQVLDSRGNPTVEVEVTAGDHVGRASVPSGASTGSHEALELRDGDESRFHGRGVLKAVGNVNTVIGPKVVGLDPREQELVDSLMIELDGTSDKSRLGANAILAVSMAVARVAAAVDSEGLYAYLKRATRFALPVPMMNVINGGEHAGNELAIQEFLIEPVGAAGCSEAIRMGAEVYQTLKGILTKRYGKGAINVGDEGGFAPQLGKTRDALSAIADAIRSSGHEDEVRVGIDAASSTFYDKRKGTYAVDGLQMSASKLEDYYSSLRDEFALFTIEDPFEEGASSDFASITRRLGNATKIVGDDIYVTNVKRIADGVASRTTNGVLIKLNQVGTVTETLEAIKVGQQASWTISVSHRSGETEDPFIAHLATATGAEFIKTGAPARGERVAKYNELIRIEEALGQNANFSGRRLSG